MTTFTKEKIERIGNILIYFSERITDLSRTKLLKLLYLLEESFLKKYGTPLLDIDFEAWADGPVSRELYDELSCKTNLLKDFIQGSCEGEVSIITPEGSFNECIFSGRDLEMLDFIVDRFSDLSANQLDNYTKQPGSPWYKVAREKGLIEDFKSGQIKLSTEKIPLN